MCPCSIGFRGFHSNILQGKFVSLTVTFPPFPATGTVTSSFSRVSCMSITQRFSNKPLANLPERLDGISVNALFKGSRKSFVSGWLCSQKELSCPQPLLPAFLDVVWIQHSDQTRKILKHIMASLQTYRAAISVKVVRFIMGDVGQLRRTPKARS